MKVAAHMRNPLADALTLRLAQPADAPAIAALLNISYRGEASRAGWTTEADLLDGLRATPDDLLPHFASADSVFLLLCQGEQLLACIHLQRHGQAAHLGMFAVQPAQQNRGLGKHLCAAAENHARQHWHSQRFVMWVVAQRHELIAYYQRRGYHLTGTRQEFPVNPARWTPKVNGLYLLEMHKPASPARPA